MKIVVPMAGEGSRFVKEGYTLPKPLIDVEGKPMIQRVVENLQHLDADFIFLVRSSHLENNPLEQLLRSITQNRCEIVPVDKLTEGAACTVLLAKDLINTSTSLLIANADQIIEYSVAEFMRASFDSDVIWTFNASNPKWSFARLGENGQVIEVAEKNPISDIATCGVYYWQEGSAFVDCAEEMLARDIRVNGEFYICPVYNIGVEYGRKIVPFFVDKMWGLGTPEDLNAYLNRA